MGNVDHDDFVELKSRVLSNPVGVQDSETGTTTSNSLLSNGLQVTGWFQAVDTMGFGLTVGAALGNWALATTTANSHAVDAETWYKSNEQLKQFVDLNLAVQVSDLIRRFGVPFYLQILLRVVHGCVIIEIYRSISVCNEQRFESSSYLEWHGNRDGELCPDELVLGPDGLGGAGDIASIEYATRNAKHHSASCDTTPAYTCRHPFCLINGNLIANNDNLFHE